MKKTLMTQTHSTDVRATAQELFMLYLSQARRALDLEAGAVRPALTAFFEGTAHEDALVRWAKWLRSEHEDEEGVMLIAADTALTLVNAFLRETPAHPALAERMRQAVQEPRPWDHPAYGTGQPSSRHPILWWGINSILSRRHQLDQYSGPHDA